MRRGSITDTDTEFVETWENVATAQNAIIHLDPRGEERMEIITGRRRFMLTTEERIILADRVADPAYNPFLNGDFRPVIVPASVTVDSNPNALSDEEIVAIFKSSELAWREWLATLDSAQTLRRMLDLADTADITLKRYKEIATRLGEVKPKTRIEQKDGDQYASMAPAQTPAQAPPPARAVRRQGGRSQDYR